MNVEAVCFDLDDTLFEYERYARAGLNAAGDWLEQETGRQLHDELQELYFEEEITDGTFDVLTERHDLPGEIVGNLVEAYHSASTPLTPYPETKAVLSALEPYERGLVTGGRGGQRKLDRLGLREFFESVIVTPDVDRTKEDPVVFRAILAELGVDPERAVYVGDDPRFDFAVPNDLGMETVRLLRGRYTSLEPSSEAAAPDHGIDHLDRLLVLLDSAGHKKL